jgi:hypothetical protein
MRSFWTRLALNLMTGIVIRQPCEQTEGKPSRDKGRGWREAMTSQAHEGWPATEPEVRREVWSHAASQLQRDSNGAS